MILDHVAERAGLIVVAAAVLDPHLLRDRDLHMINVAPIPQRLKKRIGKPEGEEVLNCLLTQVVIDPVHLRLIEDVKQRLIQRARRVQVMAEGLLDKIRVRVRSRASLALPRPLTIIETIPGGVAR
jgi:hypothetical protein